MSRPPRTTATLDWDSLDAGKYRDEAEAIAELRSRPPLTPADRAAVRAEARLPTMSRTAVSSTTPMHQSGCARCRKTLAAIARHNAIATAIRAASVLTRKNIGAAATQYNGSMMKTESP